MNELGSCPVCQGDLQVKEYQCTECGISLKGYFPRSEFCNLPVEFRYFIKVFLKTHGNIKEVEKILSISYPTIKSRLNKINELIEFKEFNQQLKNKSRMELLQSLQTGALSIDDVISQL